MNLATRDAIALVMRELISNSLNADFRGPPEDILPDYTKRIARPMDLDRIQRKLDQGGYRTAQEWYDDVCLVYTNTIEYHAEGQPWREAAEYILKKFRKRTATMCAIDPAVWFSALNKRYAKFVALAGNGPVPQGIDPLLSKIAQASTEMVPLKERELAHTVDWLSREIDHGDTAKDVVYLLSKLQPDLDFRTNDQVVIDADKLNSHARQALTLYVKAHMT
jgi:hypothetical protein